MKNNDFAMCLSADLFRLKKLKSVIVALILMALLILLTFAVCWIGSNLISRVDVVESADGDLGGVIVDENGNAGISQEEKTAMIAMFDEMNENSLMASGSIASIEFFVMIIVCIFVGKDFSNGTVRLNVSRGANRTHIFFSKWLTAAILVTFYSVFALVMCGILYSFKNSGTFRAHDFGVLMRCFSLELLVNLSIMSVFLMIAFLCRSSGSSLGVSIGLWLVLEIAMSVISTVVEISGGATEWMMFMPLQQMSVAISTAKLTATELCAVIIMPLVYMGASIGIGLGTFLKRDVK